MIKTLLIIILALVVIVLAFDGVRMYLLFKKTLVLEKNTTAFSRSKPESKMKILILGDSTAVGTGATNSQDSTAGRLGALYPEAEVLNLAENGLRISGLKEIMDTIDKKEHFDIILIQIGANDIIRLTNMKDIEKGIQKILTSSRSLGDKVVILHSGNIGESKFFPWYVRPLLTKRSLKMRELYKKEANDFGAEYVDLISSSNAGLFKEDPYRYYANDLFHLSSDGYGLWFEEIKKNLTDVYPIEVIE